MKRSVTIGDVRPAHRFDEDAVARYMRENIDGFSGDLQVQQFDAGQSNPTYLLTANARQYVLRKKPPGQLLPKAHMVDREHRIMAALSETEVPVPEMFVLCEDESLIGTPFFVMEYVRGRVFWDATFPEQSSGERRALYAETCRVLAALHNVDHEAIGLGDYGRPGNYFSRQISRWSRQYEASKTEELEPMNQLMRWLPAHVPEDDTTSIVHGDYRLDNMIFHPTEPRVIALLDWELSTIGHPLADLAYNCMSWVMDSPYHAAVGPLAGPETGIPTMDAYIADYCQKTDREHIPDWSFYLAFSFFRSASILQGVYKRGLQGNASSTTALALGALGKRAGEVAWDLVR